MNERTDMEIAAPIGSAAVGSPTPPRGLVEEIREAERDGYASAWTVHLSRDVDALSVFAAAAMSTTRVRFGVGVVPTYPRHPIALAQQAATVQALSGGRLTLGVGVSHRPTIEKMHGLHYSSPVEHMREYLIVLRSLLNEGRCTFEGTYYRVDAKTAMTQVAPVPVLVGALSAGMVRVAGYHADGIVTWLAGRRALEELVAPTLRAAAAASGRPPPRLVAAVPVAVCEDDAQARASAERVFARYGALENYRRLFERQGVSSAAELAVVGDEETVVTELRRFADAGVTELWPIVYPIENPDGDTDSLRTRRALTAMVSAG